MPQTFSDFLRMPKAAVIILAVSLGALAFAFVMQFGFDVQPCILCLWQRVPFGVAAALSATAFFVRPYGGRTRVLIGLCAFVFLVGAGLAFFHTGVERHWWLGTSGCSIQPLNAGSAESLREQLMHMAVAHCDEISWTFLGLSMANWNVPFSLALAAFSLLAARRASK